MQAGNDGCQHLRERAVGRFALRHTYKDVGAISSAGDSQSGVPMADASEEELGGDCLSRRNVKR